MSSSDSAEYKNNMRNSSNFPFIPKGGGNKYWIFLHYMGLTYYNLKILCEISWY